MNSYNDEEKLFLETYGKLLSRLGNSTDDCPEATKLDQYFNKKLSSDEMKNIENHILLCKACQSALEGLENVKDETIKSELKNDLQDWEETKGRLDKKFYAFLETIENHRRRTIVTTLVLGFRSFIQKRYAFLTLIAILLSLIGVFIINRISNNPISSSTTTLSENFIVNATLESQVANIVRSTDVQVLSPQNGINIKNNLIQFHWITHHKGPMFIKLLDNKEKELFAVEIEGNEYIVDRSKSNLKPGLYYWKLESKEDILYLGKFYIGKP